MCIYLGIWLHIETIYVCYGSTSMYIWVLYDAFSVCYSYLSMYIWINKIMHNLMFTLLPLPFPARNRNCPNWWFTVVASFALICFIASRWHIPMLSPCNYIALLRPPMMSITRIAFFYNPRLKCLSYFFQLLVHIFRTIRFKQHSQHAVEYSSSFLYCFVLFFVSNS